MEMINKKCSGCSLCTRLCPYHAIDMVHVDNFPLSKIDQEKCKHCKKCVLSLCPNVSDCEPKTQIDNVFYACKASDDIRLKSSSGGMFTVVSDWVLQNGGVVYAPIFENETNKYIRITEIKTRDKTRGSKYFQADFSSCIDFLRDDITSGTLTLLIGIPCQVAPFFSAFGSRPNFYCVDLVCHGTMNNSFSVAYFNEIKSKYKSGIKYISFRDKRFGWSAQRWNIELNNGKTIKKYDILALKAIYYSHLEHPERCFSCKYTNYNRNSDITLGDMWNIRNIDQQFDDDKGISFLKPNTEKGLRLFDAVKDGFSFIEVDKDLTIQPQLMHPIDKPSDRTFLHYGKKRNIKSKIKYAKIRLVIIPAIKTRLHLK